LNHIEFAVPREHPGGYNQHTGENKMPEFLACYQKTKTKTKTKNTKNTKNPTNNPTVFFLTAG